jgi:hypothetical protein
MHATTVERNSWRLPPDDTVQVADQRSKSAEVRLISRRSNNSSSRYSDDIIKAGFKVFWRCLYMRNWRQVAFAFAFTYYEK